MGRIAGHDRRVGNSDEECIIIVSNLWMTES